MISSSAPAKTTTSDPANKLRNLRKKLKDIESLEKKLEEGIISKPEPQQLVKVARKIHVEAEIHQIEKQLGRLNDPMSSFKNDGQRIDEHSFKGRFGWIEIEKIYVPYLFRTPNKEKYVPVQWFEKLFVLRLKVPPEVISCCNIPSVFATTKEIEVLNDVNFNHSNNYFGNVKLQVYCLMVQLEDAVELYQYLLHCQKRLENKQSHITIGGVGSPRSGFVRIGGDSVVPYAYHNNKQCVPLFYFEGETENLELDTTTISGWSVTYLKFCFKTQGIKPSLFSPVTCEVVELEKIKKFFGAGTSFEEYWPATNPFSATKAAIRPGSWVVKPADATWVNHMKNNVKKG